MCKTLDEIGKWLKSSDAYADITYSGDIWLVRLDGSVSRKLARGSATRLDWAFQAAIERWEKPNQE